MTKCLRITLLLGGFLLAGLLYAQFENAEVLGTVRDQSGGAVPKATVTLTNQDTGIKVQTSTDENGNFDFFNVKVGRYSLAVEHAGFSKATTTDVTVNVGARQRVDFAMQVGAVTESVEVTERSRRPGDRFQRTRPGDQHRGGRRTAAQRPQLCGPGAAVHERRQVSDFGDLLPSGTPREGAFNVNGMRSTYNNFLLDGLDNNSYGTSNQGYSAQLVQPSPDALAEFKVITSNYSAEYGRVGGAVVNAVMKSGTNEFHGSAYEFLRNTDLNAIGFLFSPAVFVKPTLQRNQFGATIGGPIIKNKLFFFGDYEGFRQLQRYLNFDSIPSMTDRQGILPVSVVNPLTGVVYPANTQIPIAQLNPFAAAVLSGLPPTNGPGRSNNDEALLLIRDYSDKFDAKLDGQINDRMTAFLRFSQRKDLQYYQPDLAGPSGGDGNGYIHVVDQNASLGYTWTVTPTSLIEVRMGFSHMLAGKVPPYLGGPSMSSHVRRFSGPAHDTESHRRTQHADHHRTHRHGPPDQQSAVPESYFLGSETQFLEDSGPAFPEDGLPIPEHPHRDSGHQSDLRPGHVQRGSSASPPARNWARPPAARSRPTRPATAWRISCSALPTRSTWEATRSSICGNSCTRCIFRTTTGSARS